MVKLSIKGTLGKFGYSKIPPEIADSLLPIAGMQGFKTALAKVPVKSGLLKSHIHTWYDDVAKIFYIIVSSVYANIAEFGSKNRFPHPYIRPAAKAAQNKIRSTIRQSTRDVVNKEKVASK